MGKRLECELGWGFPLEAAWLGKPRIDQRTEVNERPFVPPKQWY